MKPSRRIRPDAEHSSPDVLAQRLYDIHQRRDGFRHYPEPLPDQHRTIP